MKKILLIALVSLAFASCKKEETQSNNGLSSYIVGKWIIDDLEVDVSTAFGPLPTEVENVSGYYTFNSDNSFDYLIDADVKVTVIQDQMEIPFKRGGKGTYKVIGESAVELTENGVPSSFEIVNATSSVIVGKTESVIDTMGFELEMEIDIVLKKQ